MKSHLSACNLVLFISFAVLIGISSILADTSNTNHVNGSTVKPENALIYTRLRFAHDYFQLFEKYQHEYTTDEKEYTVRIRNDTYRNNETKEEIVTYYQNDQVDASLFTYDKHVFDALDRVYRDRLFHSNLYDYDSYEEKLKASDPSLVSDTKCHRDLSYLVDNLEHMNRLRKGEDVKGVAWSPELTAFFDAFATEEPGLLHGNNYWVGHWRTCRQRQVFHLDRAVKSRSVFFKGRYCIASLRSPNWDGMIAQRRKELEEQKHFKYPGQEHDFERFFRIQVGICLPESCDSRLIDSSMKREHDVHQLATFKLNEPFRSYKLANLYCLPDESSELRSIQLSGWLWILFMLSWSGLVLGATYYNWRWPERIGTKDMNNLDKFIYSMSIIQNYDKLTDLKSAWKDWETRSAELSDLRRQKKRVRIESACKSFPETSATTEPEPSSDCDRGTQQLRSLIGINNDNDTRAVSKEPAKNSISSGDLFFLNSFKVICMPLMMYAHIGMIWKHHDKYPLEFAAINKLAGHLVGGAVFYVDWFFVLAGFLTSYTNFVQKKVDKNRVKDWLYSVFHRYWRLAPIYLLVFWFAKSLFHQLAEGPTWDYASNNMTLRSVCHRESWIYPLALVSNLHPLYEECIMPSWYLGCAMQFYLVTPPLLILLHKSAAAGWLVSMMMIVGSISLRVHEYLTNPNTKPLALMRPRMDLYMQTSWDMHETYLSPHYRISSYLIGLLAGHYVYMVLSGRWKSVFYWANEQLTDRSSLFRRKVLRTVSSVIGFQIVAASLVASWFIFELYPNFLEKQVKYGTTFVYSTDHSLNAMGVALIIVTLMMGQFPLARLLMGHPYLTLVSRINFSVFLIQVDVIYFILQASERVPEVDPYEGLKILCVCLMVTYVMSVVMTLLLEMPLLNLERHFIGIPYFSPKRRSPKQETDPTLKDHNDAQVGPKESREISDQFQLQIEEPAKQPQQQQQQHSTGG